MGNYAYAIIFKRVGKNKRGEYKMLPADYEVGEIIIKEDGTKTFKIDDKEYRFCGDEKSLNDQIVVSFSIPVEKIMDQIEEAGILGDDENIGEVANKVFDEYFNRMRSYGFFQKYDVLGRLQNYMVEKVERQIHTYNEDDVMDNLLITDSDDVDEEVAELKPIDDEEVQEEIKIDVKNLYVNVNSAIVGQDKQIKKIVGAVCKNQIIKDPKLKQNILVIGSRGTGKTEIFKQIAAELDIPITIEDITEYGEEFPSMLMAMANASHADIGNSIDDMIVHLISNANGDLRKAERGIIVVKNIESQAKENPEIETDSVLEDLLRFMNGNIVSVLYGKKVIHFDTSKLTFVATGNFSGMYKVVGYCNDKENSLGILPEFLERCQTRVTLNDLTEEDLINMMSHSKFSPIILNQEHFATNYGVDLNFSDDAIKEIAKVSTKMKTNARAPFFVIGETLSDAEFEIQANPGVYSRLDVDKETVYDNTKYALTKKVNVRKRKK